MGEADWTQANGPAPDASKGMAQVQWARRFMPLSAAARQELSLAQPCHIAIATPLDPASASLAMWLLEAGFAVSFLAKPDGNHDLVAALQEAGAVICAGREQLLAGEPDIGLDTEGSLIASLPKSAKGGVIAGLELAPCEGAIKCPAIHLGRSALITLAASHGAGQSSVSGFLDITNLQIAGSKVLVIGYGAIGEGAAHYARSYGARVLVAEADPVKAVKAALAGHELMQLDDCLGEPVLIINALERGPALTMAQLEQTQSGVFLCSATANPEAFPLGKLSAQAPAKSLRDYVTQYELASGAKVRVVCEGQPIPIATGQGLPLEYADIQIAAQLRAIADLLEPGRKHQPGTGPLADAIEADLASKYLRAR